MLVMVLRWLAGQRGSVAHGPGLPPPGEQQSLVSQPPQHTVCVRDAAGAHSL